MFFICNNSLLFDPEAHTVSVVGQPESVLTLSAPAVRLLQEFIRHKGSELSREELITRVWQEFGFTPSGNNLNKAISELRKSFQALGEHHELIVTIPRYGFRFDADVIFQPAQNIDTSAPEPQLQKAEKRKQPPRLKWWLIFTALLASVFGIGIIIRQQQNITTAVRLKPIEQKIAKCSVWLINDHGRPLVLSKLAELLDKNGVACQREAYSVYYFSARFSLVAADEVFIGACPVNKDSLCKTIRYKSGAEK
ncbi:winged helix-turn-helix domain-containing protein [Klebsiella aerogenes]